MKTVAVIGASSDREKFGNKALRAFANKGYTVFPINPTETEVEGHPAFKSVLDVPGTIDMATIYVPTAVGVSVMDDLAKKGILEVWLNPGADAPQVVEKARALGLKTVRHCSIIAIGESPARVHPPHHVPIAGRAHDHRGAPGERPPFRLRWLFHARYILENPVRSGLVAAPSRTIIIRATGWTEIRLRGPNRPDLQVEREVDRPAGSITRIARRTARVGGQLQPSPTLLVTRTPDLKVGPTGSA